MAPRPSPRARLHDALIGLCFERGFKLVELGELLARAEVDRAAFAAEFADMEDCFFQVFKEEVERYQREAAPGGEERGAWRERVRASAYALFRFLAADERLSRFVLVESRVAGERTQVFAGQRIEALFDLIDEGRRELADPGSLTRATAESIGGGIFNQLYAVVGGGAPLPPERVIVPQVMYMVVLPYLGPAAALRELTIPPPPHPTEPRPLGAHRG
ncbi:MAG TPA: TetR/AcrR family transcriptional regulator [Solirubrobacterales bacterium]|jgi:AcrR family transcriptional regulator|nr:TetR/AcrR family transcriptional regulator [Solirubrobacterales bacterium]